MPYGYIGKILRVNLSSESLIIEKPPENFYCQYFGGESFVGYFLLNEFQRGVDPLGSNNTLIFATGLLTGVPECHPRRARWPGHKGRSN